MLAPGSINPASPDRTSVAPFASARLGGWNLKAADFRVLMSAPSTTLRTQVLVIGSGASGISAALAAARNGAQTLLVENAGFLGGISATLPWLGFHDRDYRLVVKGLPLEFVKRLQEAGAASAFELDPKCGSAVSINCHWWKIIAMQLMREAGVGLLLHTQVVETLRQA